LGDSIETLSFNGIYRLQRVPCRDALMSWSHGCERTTYVQILLQNTASTSDLQGRGECQILYGTKLAMWALRFQTTSMFKGPFGIPASRSQCEASPRNRSS